MEIWKDINDYEGLYRISNMGHVSSISRPRMFGGHNIKIGGIILKPHISVQGYECVTICKNGNCKRFYVHQLMAITFLNHSPNGNTMVVDHIDEIKTNNNISNLRIITHGENSHRNRGIRKRTSNYKGVGFMNGKYYSKYKNYYIGWFKKEIDAVNARLNYIKYNS